MNFNVNCFESAELTEMSTRPDDIDVELHFKISRSNSLKEEEEVDMLGNSKIQI